MIPTKTIQLDFWRHPTDILHLVQGEADGRKIEFKITDNGSAADLTGFIAIFAIKKPDGNVVVNSATITEAELGIVETTISSQVVTTAGNAHAELHLMKEGQLSKSFRIVTKVAPGVDIDGIAPSVSEFNALQTLIGQAETVISIADTELWPEVVANAQYFSDLAGTGRTVETVKANADDIAAVEAEIETARDGAATLGSRIDAIEAVQNFKLKNEIENSGNFTGTTKWNVVTSGTLSVISSELVATIASGQAGVTARNTVTKLWQSNAKYYCRVSAKVKNEGMSSLRARLGNHTAVLTVVGNEVVNPVADTLYNIDGLVIPLPGNVGNEISLWVNTVGAEGNQLAIKSALLIDLTDIFGAGNEPTLIEIRELIKLIPNQWWDGELTLTQKQFLTWQLNLIRKNTNAIIAIGGTIV